MPGPAITKGSDHFFNVLYEGNGGGQRVGNFVPFTDNGTIDKSVIKKSLQNIPDGGISGKLLYKKSNKTLKKVNKFSKGKLQVIGLGGVDNGDSAYQKIKLGASGIQLYSGLIFKGPDVIEDILSNLLIILQKAKK